MTFNVHTLDPQKVTASIIVVPGVNYKASKVIEFKDVYIAPREYNHARVTSKDPNHVTLLMDSFTNGIEYDRRPPIVREKARQIDGVIYKYELVCGHHRLEAMKRLGYDRWIFWVYEIGLNGYTPEASRVILQIVENDHAAVLPSSVEDAVGAIIYLLSTSSEQVQNTEQSIRDFVDTYCKNMNGNKKGKVVRQVMAKAGTYRRIVTFTADDAFEWIETNTNYSKAGEYDARRKKYGWSVLEGYEYEQLFNSIKKFSETGKESYFICRTKAPTKKADLNTKRKGIINEFKHLEDCLIETFKFYQENGRFPWHVEAFIPQDTELENSTKPILVE
jgi:hypothetical protein